MTTAPHPTTTRDGRLMPVLVGYDGSRPSVQALTWAAAEAERRGTRLVVLYAANYPGMTTTLPGEGLLTMEPGALGDAADVTEEAVAKVRADHPSLDVSGRTEVTGAAEALVAAAAEAVLLVVGTRARPRVLSALTGSVAYAVSGGSPCPVVVVKDNGGAKGPAAGGRIVVGSDGSPASEAALDFAAHHAASVSAPLEVVCGEYEDFTATVPESALRAERDALAERIGARLALDHPTVAVTVSTPDGSAQEVLVEASADAALVVVGSRGRGALSGLVLGSVSQAVIHDAVCPVAVISPASAPDPHEHGEQDQDPARR